MIERSIFLTLLSISNTILAILWLSPFHDIFYIILYFILYYIYDYSLFYDIQDGETKEEIHNFRNFEISMIERSIFLINFEYHFRHFMIITISWYFLYYIIFYFILYLFYSLFYDIQDGEAKEEIIFVISKFRWSNDRFFLSISDTVRHFMIIKISKMAK